MNSIPHSNNQCKSKADYKVIEVRDNIVRVKSGLFVINVLVDRENNKITVPDNITAHNFGRLVALVLSACKDGVYNHAKDSTE